MLRRVGLRVADTAGLVADPLTGRWTTGRDLSVNYLVAAAADYPSARGTQGMRETSMPSSASASACSGLVSP